MKVCGMRLQEALDHLKEKRAIVQPNDSFMEQLTRYDEQLTKVRVEKAEKDKKHGISKLETRPCGKSTSVIAKGPIGPARGPSLPPHLAKAREEERDEAPTRIGPTLPPKSGASIGPSLPPGFKRPLESGPDDKGVEDAPSACTSMEGQGGQDVKKLKIT